jgi:hypothetical protein
VALSKILVVLCVIAYVFNCLDRQTSLSQRFKNVLITQNNPIFMKKIIITTLCLFAVLPMAFAQAEKLFQANVEDYQKNPMKNISERATDDYVLVSGSGYIANKAQIVALFKNVNRVEVSFKDLKVRQFGNTVIATGKEHSVRHYNDGTPDLTTDYLSTYVYEIKDNRLVSLSGQHTIPAAK